MYSLNEVTINHIQQLKDIQLSELLHLLLLTEAKSNVLEGWDVSVPFNITTGDAGADGKMRWTGNPTRTANVPNKFTIFQNKATELIPSKCFEEILETEKAGQPRKLKAQIKKLVEANGCYILFTTQPLVDKGKEERIKEFRRAIAAAGHANATTIQIEVYDANRIKDWVNQNIETVLFVQRCNGITRPAKFIIWKELGTELQAKETPFQTNEATKEYITAIQNAIGAQKAMRISGHSGLGKTRLIYEALKAEDSKPAVTSGLVYYDLGLATGIDEITNFLVSHRLNQQGTIVIDNCDAPTHVSLARLVKSQGNLKIITIGFDDSREIEDPKIKLDRNNQRDLVSAIVEQKLGTSHDFSDKEYVKTVSEGYPWMAVKFCTGILQNGMSNLSQYSLDEFIRKLLFNAPTGNEEYAVICACSVFSAFGFYDDSLRGLVSPEIAKTLQAQMDFIRMEIYDGTLSDSRFREICLKFRKEDIIEKRGTFYMVKPTVLAIHLAAYWMTITSPDKIKKVIESLKNISLEEKFIDRLSDLDQLDKAKDLVSELWGEDGFFGSAEVLSTEWGSLLFRYVVEVNPQATMEALYKVYASKTTDEIRAMITPRRNLVWALEKLVFRHISFEKAARLLYRFAVAENETWGNNATNQFIQLFQLFLPGTEVSYKDRVNIIRWGMKQHDGEFARIGVLALGRGLMYDHFSRGGGAENQGSSMPLKDFTPSTWQEIFDYWKDILEILVPIASTENPLAVVAREAIVKAIRSLTKYGQIELVHDTIKTINNFRPKFWPEALDGLKRTLNYEKQLPDHTKNLIKELIQELTLKDMKTQLYLTVSKPEWTYTTPEDLRGEKQVQKANELAELIIKDSMPIEDHLLHILRNEQRQGFTFGKRLGEISADPQTLAQQMLTVLADIPKAEQNPEVLAGLLIGADDQKLIYSVYHQMMAEEKVAHHAFYLARIAKMGIDEVEKLFDVIDKFNLTVSYFSSFQYGGAATNFSVEEIIKLSTKLKSYGMAGRWTSLAIVFAYCYDDQERFQQCASVLKVIIGEVNMGLADANIHTMESFQWSEVVSKLLIDKKDSAFAKIIMQQIVEMYSDHLFRNELDHYIPRVMQVLLDNYFDETWNILSNALLGSNYIFLINIRSAIGTKNGWMGGNGVLFENVERNKKILEWCKQHPELAPKRIASMMPLQASNSEKTTWNAFTRSIIDTFGNQKSVLDELSANMGTYGSVGSSVDYLEMLKALVTELVGHCLEEVRDWADKYLSYLEKEIKREQLDNEEDSI